MKSVAILTTLIGSAAAFAPAQVAHTSTAVNGFANDYVGGEGPEPMPFAPTQTSVNFDPAGFAEVGVVSSKSVVIYIMILCVDGEAGLSWTALD